MISSFYVYVRTSVFGDLMQAIFKWVSFEELIRRARNLPNQDGSGAGVNLDRVAFPLDRHTLVPVSLQLHVLVGFFEGLFAKQDRIA